MLLSVAHQSLEAMEKRDRELELKNVNQQQGDNSLCQQVLTQMFSCKETRLDVEVWEVDGHSHGGAHYPLYVSTNFTSARSRTGMTNRSKKKQAPLVP